MIGWITVFRCTPCPGSPNFKHSAKITIQRISMISFYLSIGKMENLKDKKYTYLFFFKKRFCHVTLLVQPSASADNTDLGFDNSWYHAQPHPIIVYYTQLHQLIATSEAMCSEGMTVITWNWIDLPCVYCMEIIILHPARELHLLFYLTPFHVTPSKTWLFKKSSLENVFLVFRLWSASFLQWLSCTHSVNIKIWSCVLWPI